MSDLEDAVKPLISPAILGLAGGIKLNAEQQKTVARWVAKTLMVFENIGRPPELRTSFFSPKERLAMCEPGAVPANSFVWLAGRDGREPPFLSHRSKSLALPAKPPFYGRGEGHSGTLVIGWLIVQFFSFWRKRYETSKLELPVNIYTPRIWRNASITNLAAWAFSERHRLASALRHRRVRLRRLCHAGG
jgi:hypothetical protein